MRKSTHCPNVKSVNWKGEGATQSFFPSYSDPAGSRRMQPATPLQDGLICNLAEIIRRDRDISKENLRFRQKKFSLTLSL